MSNALAKMEADLRWYFRGGAVESDSPLRSSTGALLERVSQFTLGSDGELIESIADVESKVWAYNVRATNRPAALYDAIEDYDSDPSITAQSTVVQQQYREPATRGLDESSLRQASIARRLRGLSIRQRGALGSLYVAGDRWLRHELGRKLAIYPLTQAGQRILSARAERFCSAVEADSGGPTERLASEWAHQRKHQDGWMLELFDAARDEASALLLEAMERFAEED